MKRKILFFASFLLFAFTMPAESFNRGLVNTKTGDEIKSLKDVKATPALAGEGSYNKTLEEAFDKYTEDSFDRMDLRGTGLKLSVYRKALIGYQNMKHNKHLSPNKSVLTIVDFTKSSKHKRLWVIDLKTKKLLFHSLVAHGQGSGGDMAVAFSNNPNSYQSSVGFYVTAQTYQGKHGLSLKLAGQDAGYNTNAMKRAIVVHGADYVSKDFIKRQGRLGRSQGCPALPTDLNEKIINIIKDRTCLYIEGGLDSYSSVYLNKAKALAQFAAENKVEVASS